MEIGPKYLASARTRVGSPSRTNGDNRSSAYSIMGEVLAPYEQQIYSSDSVTEQGDQILIRILSSDDHDA